MKENLTNVTNEEIQAVKMNKKGFSLVELIVVIAIMAILVGAVGMTVLPYIEKGRVAKDMQSLSGLCTAAQSAFAQNAATVPANANFDITCDSTGNTSNPTTLPAAVIKDLVVLSGGTAGTENILDLYKFESKTLSPCTTILIHYDGTGKGNITVTAKNGSNVLGDPISSK